MIRIVLLRHAEAAHAPGLAIGQLDAPLAPAGAQAAQAAAARWDLPLPDRLVCSDLARARETAAPLARRFALEPRVDPRWREMAFGEWEGRAFDSLPPAALDRWTRGWLRRGPPGGESYLALRRRVRPALVDALEGLSADGCLLVVAHGGPIRVVLADLLGLPPRQAFRLACDPLHAAVIERSGRWRRLCALNRPPAGLWPCVEAGG